MNLRRETVRKITGIERIGGIRLGCGCFLHVSAVNMRRLLEIAGPQAVLDALGSVMCEIHSMSESKRSVISDTPEETQRGYISTEWTFWCGKCDKWDQIASEVTKKGAVSHARKLGWRNTTEHGWLCRKCSSKDSK